MRDISEFEKVVSKWQEENTKALADLDKKAEILGREYMQSIINMGISLQVHISNFRIPIAMKPNIRFPELALLDKLREQNTAPNNLDGNKGVQR